MIIYRGYFNDYKNLHEYKVEFLLRSRISSVIEIKLSEHSPIILKTNGDKLFESIKTQSATVKIVSNDYLFDLYDTSFSVGARIYKDNTMIFDGYVSPDIYTQDYNNVSVISIQCISKIAKLKYYDYIPISGNTELDVYNIKDILMNIIGEEIYYCAPTRLGIDGYIYNDGLNHIYLDENNFFEDNEDKTPWKQYEVIEEICKILGVSLVEHECKYYMIQYRSDISTSYTQTVYSQNSYNISTVTQTPIPLDSTLFASSNNNVSLEETFSKIRVKVNTYPYDDVVNYLLDSDKWSLMNEVYNNVELKDIQNSVNVPYLKYDRSDGKHFAIYYLYYKTGTMLPYMYDVDLDSTTHKYYNTRPDTFTPNDWMKCLINDPTSTKAITDHTKVGMALMKIAAYEDTNATLVSSLPWKEQIVMYTGLNNINIHHYNDIATTDDYQEWWGAIWSHLYVYLDAYNDSGLDADYLPQHPLLEIKSENDVIISNDSYLVISGQIGINDAEFIDSQPKEWNGSDNFNRPEAFNLIDQGQEGELLEWKLWNMITLGYINNRKYWGFNTVDIQIRIGDDQSPLNDKICCPYVYTDPNTGSRYTQYVWLTADEYVNFNVEAHSSLNYHFAIPVGTDKWSWYKMYDITNTCDWRLGLDGANGFAIPLPKKSELSGKLKIYICAPNYYTYYRYIDGRGDVIDQPTASYTVTVTPNPDNIWKYNHSLSVWNDFNVTYSYQGCLPSCVLIQNLKFDIKPVQFYTLTDTINKNANNKKTDHVYENLLNAADVTDAKEIEVKINTQDPAKNRSFSSMLKLTGNQGTYQYIEKMWSGERDEHSDPIDKVQEENVIDTYTEHYIDKKIIFDCDLLGCEYKPLDIIQHEYFNDKLMIVNSQEQDLHAGSTKIKLVEI